MWENANSSFKSVETPINLHIILFINHSRIEKNKFFVILRIFSEMY